MFSIIDSDENLLREDGSVNWKSHYFTSFWCAISLIWCLVLWRGAALYWSRYREIYYEHSDKKSVKESSTLLAK